MGRFCPDTKEKYVKIPILIKSCLFALKVFYFTQPETTGAQLANDLLKAILDKAHGKKDDENDETDEADNKEEENESTFTQSRQIN